MKQILVIIMCAMSLVASAQGIIVHETNNNKISFKTTDVTRIEFTENETETTSSTYATKEELNTETTKLACETTELQCTVAALNEENAKLACETTELQCMVAALNEENARLKCETTELQSEMAALKVCMQELSSVISELKKQIEWNYYHPATFGDITIDGKTYRLGMSGAIDLGLSVKWAAMNIGATAPASYGDYYAWGETETKSTYNWSTYLDSPNRDGNSFTKYASDKKTTLDPEDDVACVKCGGDWRMPTEAEIEELRNNCTWVWLNMTEYNSGCGYVVVGSTGNAIFLPATGGRSNNTLQSNDVYCNYWSSSLSSSESSAYALNFGQDTTDRTTYNYRAYGRTVRAVCP